MPSDTNMAMSCEQKALIDFWSRFSVQDPTLTTTLFPPSLYNDLLPYHISAEEAGASSSRKATSSYEEAAQHCRDRVTRIVKASRHTNTKFTDQEFNIWDAFVHKSNIFLKGLLESEPETKDGDPLPKLPEVTGPKSCKRVNWIFEDPVFVKKSFTKSEVHQGRLGNCWLVGGLASMGTIDGLIDKICVARDEEAGVYGFVFHRDGVWVPVVIDDFLYLNDKDWSGDFDPDGTKAQAYRKLKQTGSKALFFGKCNDDNETWFPLLEKAFAKIHGDYAALIGGWIGEAVEDMTGGVSTQLMAKSVLDRERLWKELTEKPGNHLFSVLTLPDPEPDTDLTKVIGKQGLAASHAYSMIKAVEEKGEDEISVQLIQLRNPWGHSSRIFGHGSWAGPWSNGSKEWTPYWLQKLDYSFSDNGTFWISFEDLLDRFACIERTKLFSEDWTVVQEWTSLKVPWVDGFSNSKFLIEVKEAGPFVIAFTQLDDTYFKGLQGQYSCKLTYILRKVGSGVNGEYIARVQANSWYWRSVSLEIELEAGSYEVLPMIRGKRKEDSHSIQDVLKKYVAKKPEKLKQIGMNRDWAFAKALASRKDASVITVGKKDNHNLVDHIEASQGCDGNANICQEKGSAEDLLSNPWSMVCVCGLRIHTKDKNLSITLVNALDNRNEAVQMVGEVVSST